MARRISGRGHGDPRTADTRSKTIGKEAYRPSRDEILRFIAENPDRTGKRDIAKAFALKGDDCIWLKDLLRDLQDEGLLTKERKRLARVGVDVEPVFVGRGQWQAGEKIPRRPPELAARPFDRDHGLDVHGLVWVGDGAVMVALHGDSAVADEAHHRLDGPLWIGAIADIVAEQNEALRAARARVVEAGPEGLAVGVDIGKQGDQHDLSFSVAALTRRTLTFVNARGAAGAAR